MKLISNAPWWLISAGIHAVILMGAALVIIERAFAVDTPPIVVDFTERRVVLPPDPPEKRDAFSRKSLPSDEPDKSKNDDPIIWFPGAKPADRNESANEMDKKSMRGESLDFLGYVPGGKEGHIGRTNGPNAGRAENIGVGGGAGYSGRHGTRDGGGREDLVKVGGGGTVTENAVTAALRWLARHQNADGSWSASGYNHRCVNGKCSGTGDAEYDPGVTSLSLLAFLGAGYSQLSRDTLIDPAVPGQTLHFGDVVKRGLQWLVAHQDPEGCVGERGTKYMYNHTIAALALSEAYGMTSAPVLLDPSQKAIDFVIAAQNPGKGWRYGARDGMNDTSVTGWAVMALKSAELSGLRFPRSAYDGAVAWLNEATESNGYYRVGYTQAGTGKVYVPGKNEQFDHHESMSAVAVMSKIFINKKRDPSLTAVNLMMTDLPAWQQGKVDFYYWYYASLALFQYDGPKGAFWSKWNEPMKNAIVPHQKTAKNGCENGSWDPSADRWGFEGGRVYAAAINALTLEVYYRYAHVFGTK
jgi:hypothetical protein